MVRTMAKVLVNLVNVVGVITDVQALIDTGAEISVIGRDCLPKGTIELPSNVVLNGAFAGPTPDKVSRVVFGIQRGNVR